LVVGSAWSSPAIRREPSAPTIRDAAYHRLVAVMDPSFKATRKVPIPTLQADQGFQLRVFLLQFNPQRGLSDRAAAPPRSRGTPLRRCRSTWAAKHSIG